VIGKKLIKWISIVGSACLLLGIMGSFALAAKKKLTPAEFIHLPKKDKLEYKNVVIRPMDFSAFFNQKTLPDFAERILIGDLTTAREWYNIALFYLEHPEVKFEVGVSAVDPTQTMAALAAGTVSSYFRIQTGGGVLAWKEMGAIADITDLVKNWDQAEHLLAKI